jgi:hypothetical protein
LRIFGYNGSQVAERNSNRANRMKGHPQP